MLCISDYWEKSINTNMSKVSAIVQARMDSSRFPGKTMMDIAGKPMLAHIIERLERVSSVEEIIVATSIRDSNKPIADLAEKYNIPSFRGSEEDVLDRYYQAARKHNSNVIVRITADCPFVDPQVINKVVHYYLGNDCDYVSNTLERTFPDGLDVEVFSCSALEKAWKEARFASEREHVTPYIWKQPSRFKLSSVKNEVDLSQMRWVVDKEKDLEFARRVYKYLYIEGRIFHMEDVLELLQEHPDLEKINQGTAQDEGYAKSLRGDRIVK